MHSRRRVLIYRSELLAPSETFIAAQAGALEHFEPVFTGLKRRPGLALPASAELLTRADSFPERARRFLYRKMGVASALVERLERLNPVLVHAHFAVDGSEALPLVRALNLPLVVTLHGYDVMMDDRAHALTTRGRAYLRTRAALWSRAGLFLCVSEAIRAKAIERGFPAEKLAVHAIGIDLACFEPDRSAARTSGTVLFVGRLVEKKGCAHLLRAMAEVRRQVTCARLIVIGDGPFRLALEAEAVRLGVAASFLGMQSPAQVRLWMASARVLAAPSITAANGDAEGLPMVLCEAMAMGLPVAAFRSSGIGELVCDGQTGLLAEERDEAAMARNIARLFQDEALHARLSLAGRACVEARYNLATQTAALEEHYRNAIREYHLRPDEEGCSSCAWSVAADRQKITTAIGGTWDARD